MKEGGSSEWNIQSKRKCDENSFSDHVIRKGGVEMWFNGYLHRKGCVIVLTVLVCVDEVQKLLGVDGWMIDLEGKRWSQSLFSK
jgi:hypothetical protein